MVLLAITPAGLAVALRAAAADDAVCCGSDAITEAGSQTHRDARLSRFNDELGDGVLDSALESIKERHPGQTIWVETAG
jgi:hypothetical protein